MGSAHKEVEMKPSEGVARFIILIAGVVLACYVTATPGDRFLFAAIAGVCLGITGGYILANIE